MLLILPALERTTALLFMVRSEGFLQDQDVLEKGLLPKEAVWMWAILNLLKG